MATEQGQSRSSGASRATFGVVLFIVWGVLTILWVYDAIYKLVHGEAGPAIKAVICAPADAPARGHGGPGGGRHRPLEPPVPGPPDSDLAAWLAARQLFVALIVTAATLLAERDSLAIPFVATPFTGAVALKIFNLVFTTLTCCGSCRSSRSTWPRRIRTAT